LVNMDLIILLYCFIFNNNYRVRHAIFIYSHFKGSKYQISYFYMIDNNIFNKIYIINN
jgi:hypothetical protein